MTPQTLPCGDSLLLVPIPEDAERFNIYGLDKSFTRVEWFLPTTPMAIHVSADVGKYDILHKSSILGKFNSSDKQVDFEIKEEWVERKYGTYNGIAYKKYSADGGDKWYINLEQSFISLLSHLISSNKIESKMVLVILISK